MSSTQSLNHAPFKPLPLKLRPAPSLGADHDGDGNQCNPNTNNIMSSTHSDSDDANKVSRMFQFSKCTVDYFKKVLTGLNDGLATLLSSLLLSSPLLVSPHFTSPHLSYHLLSSLHYTPSSPATNGFASRTWCAEMKKLHRKLRRRKWIPRVNNANLEKASTLNSAFVLPWRCITIISPCPTRLRNWCINT